MSACAQCGTVARPGDKFCNTCGTPIARGAAAPAQAYGTPPPAPPLAPPQAPPGYAPQQVGAYGAPAAPPLRCQLGHEIVPGASYCAQGHPLALDQMQFANDPYGAAPGGFGVPPPAQPGYSAPPVAPGGGFGGPPLPGGYGAPAAQPLYTPPPAQAAYGSPGALPPFGAPPPQAGYAPQPQGGYGPPPQANPYLGGAAGPPLALPIDAAREVAPPKVLRGFLVAYGTNPAGDFWPLTAGRHVVGRTGAAEGVDVSLQDPTISSRHAALVVDGASGSVSVEDTGSTNGTFVNDEHIGFNGRRELRDGDRLRFGGFTTIVKVIGRA